MDGWVAENWPEIVALSRQSWRGRKVIHMGIALRIAGVVLIVLGAAIFLYVMLGVGREFDSATWAELRAYADTLLPSGDGLVGRTRNVIAFLVLVGPGIAVFYAANAFNRRR